MKTTGKYSIKKYRCVECNSEKEIGTNHWGEIYPYCYHCNKITVWECLEKMPKGYKKPEPWKRVKLGDICEIKQGIKIKKNI